MKLDYSIYALSDDEHWKILAKILGGANKRVVKSIIRHLKKIRVVSCLLESRYIDRDYSSDYLRFYAQTFYAYDRHCQRIHFFACDISEILMMRQIWSERLDALQQASNTSYCGFIVIRPLPSATIGRTVLLAKGPSGIGLESTVTCRAYARAHLLGADLDVIGTSFMQQDSRVGACAQVAIWIGARHMHQRYKHNWLSVADITRLAAPNTSEEASSIPAGSDFLTAERMIRAINEMGFQPLCFSGSDIGPSVLPYVESGLPVILGVQPKNYPLGHAITVIGRVFSEQDKPTNRAVDYVSGFIVHDDQAGPYMLLPMNKDAADDPRFDRDQIINYDFGDGSVNLTVSDYAKFAIALMPIRVFSTAEAAELTAKNRIYDALEDMPKVLLKVSQKGGQLNAQPSEYLVSAFERGEIILRTYLTSASGYRRHIATSTACDDLKDVILRINLPHFTWVTEISTLDSYNHASPGMRRIYGHTVLDATSTGKDVAGLLMLHLPNVIFLRDINAAPGQRQETIANIPNDRLYECREKRFDR